jgi:hypothetical protein
MSPMHHGDLRYNEKVTVDTRTLTLIESIMKPAPLKYLTMH